MLEQPLVGYRAGLDAALIAAAASALADSLAGPVRMAEVGCGVGAALLSAAVRCPAAEVTGIERDPAALALAEANIARNALSARVHGLGADALAKPGIDAQLDALHRRFDIVFSNPPFFDDDSAIRDPHPARRAAYVADAPLLDWLKAMLRLVRPKGLIAMIHRADRAGDIIALCQGRAGDLAVWPVRPHAAAPAKRVVVTARAGSRGPLRLLAGLDLHDAPGSSAFSEAAQSIFDGGPIAALRRAT